MIDRSKLITERLIIREVSQLDVENVHQLHLLPETDQFNTLGIPESKLVTSELAKKWIDEQNLDPQPSFVFCIQLKELKQFVGLIGINLGKSNFRNAEVWYKIHVDHWNKGYTTEALVCVLKFGFVNLKLHRIEAGCAVENVASIRVLEKVGMIREGMKRKNLPIRGEWQDSYIYSVLEEEFSTP